MRRCLQIPPTSWFLRKISPNPPRFYCSSPSISTPDSVNPKTPDSDSNVCIKNDQVSSSSKEPMFGNPIEKAETDPYLSTLWRKKFNPELAHFWHDHVQKQYPDLLPKNPFTFCVLLHILATASEYHGLIIKWLDSYVSSDSCPDGILLYHLLLKVESWDKMAEDFKFRPWVYSPLLTAYARADRCSDAIDCLYAMLSNDILPNSVAVNALLRLLIRKGMIFEAKKLYADIVSKGVFYDCETVRIMMNLSLQQGNVEESEKYFLDARGHPPVQNAMSHNYTNAIDFVCNKLDSEGAFVLLSQMVNLGITPSEETFTNVICTCVKKGNIDFALMASEEMRKSGLSLKTSVLTSLMKGFNLQGDLRSALELFDMMSEFRVCPDQDAYAAIIEGCGNHGNMDKAVELNNQMKLAGIPSSGEIVHSLIKGYFKAGMPDEGVKLLEEARKDDVANTFTYDDVLGWFRKVDMTDDFQGEDMLKQGTALYSVVATAQSCERILNDVVEIGDLKFLLSDCTFKDAECSIFKGN